MVSDPVGSVRPGWFEGLVYDPESRRHTYRGRAIPSVTQVTAPMESGMFRIDPAMLGYAASRGRAAHALTQYWDEGDLDEESIDPELTGYLDAWKAFRTEQKFEPWPAGIERVIFSQRWMYTGRLDRLGELDGEPTLIDIKTGLVGLAAQQVQLAAYLQAVNEEVAEFGSERVRQAMVVSLTPVGEYRMLTLTNVDDHWREFLTLLSHYRYMEKYG